MWILQTRHYRLVKVKHKSFHEKHFPALHYSITFTYTMLLAKEVPPLGIIIAHGRHKRNRCRQMPAPVSYQNNFA
jgi:hypothetical protein